MLTLAAKLKHLVRRLSPDQPFSERHLSAAVRELPGHTRGGSRTAINKLLRGIDDNPTVVTLMALAQVLGAPAPFLLPGWDDLTALSVLQRRPQAVEILRHLDGVPEADLRDLLEDIKKRRMELGLPQTVDPVHIDPHDQNETDPHDPRRRSPKDSARYAADSLEGT
jgi:transcriptional regulator with XRE-family HTH domain